MAHTDRLEAERRLWRRGFRRVMGLDEVGRGCLSGPVVAAGVILAPQFGSASHPKSGGLDYSRLRDSKTIPAEERDELAEQIKKSALYWTIRQCDPVEIDRLNILHASIQAMVRCAEGEGHPDFLLVDGNRYTDSLIPYECIVGGDNLSASIAAASILAKTFRDDLMKSLHNVYPWYGWDTNVGYPTKAHFDGLLRYGYTPHHRRSFRLRTDTPCRRDATRRTG